MEIIDSEYTLAITGSQLTGFILNVVKTNFIIFKSHRKITPINITLESAGILLVQVESAKFLGVIFDRHISWRDHINFIAQNIAKSIGIINRISHLLPEDIGLNLYYFLVLAYLSYCNMISASTYGSRLSKLDSSKKGSSNNCRCS